MKHNDQAIFIVTFVNYDEPMNKVIKLRVPFSTLKVINSKNEQEPIDIICESEGSCDLYLFVALDGWSEISVKLVPT